MIEWIDVRESPPKEGEYVLLAFGDQVAEGWYSTDYRSRWRATRTPGTPLTEEVHHWALLPMYHS